MLIVCMRGKTNRLLVNDLVFRMLPMLLFFWRIKTLRIEFFASRFCKLVLDSCVFIYFLLNHFCQIFVPYAWYMYWNLSFFAITTFLLDIKLTNTLKLFKQMIPKAQRIYEMVILATGFGTFEFFRTFWHFWKFQFEFPAFLDFWGISRTSCRAKAEEKKCGKIQIPRIM